MTISYLINEIFSIKTLSHNRKATLSTTVLCIYHSVVTNGKPRLIYFCKLYLIRRQLLTPEVWILPSWYVGLLMVQCYFWIAKKTVAKKLNQTGKFFKMKMRTTFSHTGTENSAEHEKGQTVPRNPANPYWANRWHAFTQASAWMAIYYFIRLIDRYMFDRHASLRAPIVCTLPVCTY